MLTLRSLARSLGLAAAVAGLAALPFAAQAATSGSRNLSGEIWSAQHYLAFAAHAKSVAATHRALYSALNCLEGPKGKWFYPKKGFNPCYGSYYARGAIDDATSQQQMRMLERMAAQAHAALMSRQLTTAHHDAMMTAADLKKLG